MHGALPIENGDVMGCFALPWLKDIRGNNMETCEENLVEWIEQLDRFRERQLDGWRDYSNLMISEDECWASDGGYANQTEAGKRFGDLMQYGMNTLPDRSKTFSCVYNSWMDDGLPRDDLFDDSSTNARLGSLFDREGVQLIASGHQPVGDMPWPIRLGKNKYVLPCDTSFSGETMWATHDGSSPRVNLGKGSSSSGRGDVAFW